MTTQDPPRPIFLDDPWSPATEAYRMVRSHLRHAMPGPCSVLVTSAEVGAGKSSVTTNLGISLAQTDHRVLLVDADLRRPVLHTLLRVPGALGLSSYLSGTAMLEAVVTRTSVPNLSLIPSGPITPNAADLLSSPRMRELLSAVAQQYDVVLVDSPPVLVASDAATLAPAVDGILLVVGNRLPDLVLRRAKEQLEAVHGRILGAVVNQGPAHHAGHRALVGLRRVPRAAARLSRSGRAVATLGAAAAARSGRGLRAAGQEALSGLARASLAGARGLEHAGRGVGALGAAAAARSERGLRAVGQGALSGLASAARAAARLGTTGHAFAALGAATAARSGRGLRAAGQGALSGLASAARAAARLGTTGHAFAVRGAATAARSGRRLRAAGQGALGGLAGAFRAWAERLERAGRGVGALGAAAARTGQRRLRYAVGNLTPPRRTWARYLGSPGRAVANLGLAFAETTRRQLGHVREGAWRTAMTAVGGFATGFALVLIATGLLGRPVTPPGGTPPVAGKVAASQGSRTTRAAEAIPPRRQPASRPIAAGGHPAIASAASSLLEVVAIRFGAVDRQRPDWKWSWRVTVYKPNDAARVNARLEYVELQGSTRRLVGYEELCGLRLAGGRLESIEGSRTISAADSRRISTMTATFSAAENADPTACRPRSTWGRASIAPLVVKR